MSKRLFVGNLAYNTQESDLQTAFAPYGVSDVHMPTDRMSGRPRGFAFVTVEDNQAQAAIQAWEGKDLGGRTLTVNEAQPREDRGFGGGGGGGRGGDRGDRGGDRGGRGNSGSRW
jgi:RNA recognition motif-containing protein